MGILSQTLPLVLIAILSGQGESFTATLDEACTANRDPIPYTTSPPKKQLKESCTKTSECSMGGSAILCKDGKCTCAPNYSPYTYTRRISPNSTVEESSCQINPSYGQICADECQWPYKCLESNLTINFARFFSLSTQPPGPIKTCQCVQPFKMFGGCILDCQPDEVPGKDTCHKRCGENEIQLPNFECKPLAGLGSACEADQQCTAPFSECGNGKCRCRQGFKEDGAGSCAIAAARCEYGSPLRPVGSGSDAAPVSCVFRSYVMSGSVNPLAETVSVVQAGVTSRPPPPDENDATCPSDHYCQPVDGPRGDKSMGICCPYPRPYCPVGEPHPSANCSNVRSNGPMMTMIYQTSPPYPGYRPEEDQNQCPYDTHYCFIRQDASPYSGYGTVQATCCPRVCPRQSVLVNGRCLPLAPISGKCQANEQCSESFADCINGVCACPAKTREVKQPQGKRCVAACDYYMFEVEINNRCYPRLKVGDRCRGQESRCPYSSFCNSSGICQCPCNYVSVDGIFCAYPPSCPAVHHSASTVPYGMYQYTTPRANLEEFKKLTFCHYDQSRPSPISDTVETCPEKQFCNSYMGSLGICCDIPDPYCPYNNDVHDKCEIRRAPFTSTSQQPCKPGQFCFQYFYGGPNITNNAVCCDNYVYQYTTRRFEYQPTSPRFYSPFYTSQNPFQPVYTTPNPYQPTATTNQNPNQFRSTPDHHPMVDPVVTHQPLQ